MLKPKQCRSRENARQRLQSRELKDLSKDYNTDDYNIGKFRAGYFHNHSNRKSKDWFVAGAGRDCE
jgi:hypothetical protein